ncbi:hypothetical protein [Actinomycetospora soli]|uniref:hypothetical protein n=1 Tax=Actinomycetospora soli TaxID=2893887 RepID=UPI001E34E0AF|nr:hypothetical protein [Actinomycetospora soli]MCD2191011.1 hypothetical protein [Actinomycetospora soli]
MLATPPELFDPATGAPPGDAWDVQVVAPPAYIAWLEQQARRGSRDRYLAAGLAAYEPAMGHAVAVLAAAFPDVPMTPQRHDQVSWSRTSHPHVHVFLAAHDRHGRAVTRAELDNAGAEAWIAQLDRLIDVTDAQPELGIIWTRSGIEGVNHGRVIDHTCFGLYGPFQAILACP